MEEKTEVKNHMHCEICGKVIYFNEKPSSHTNTLLIGHNILCSNCVEALGGCGD